MLDRIKKYRDPKTNSDYYRLDSHRSKKFLIEQYITDLQQKKILIASKHVSENTFEVIEDMLIKSLGDESGIQEIKLKLEKYGFKDWNEFKKELNNKKRKGIAEISKIITQKIDVLILRLQRTKFHYE